MRAVVVHEPGGPDVLTLEDRPIPAVRPGWVLVRVGAFGLNRAELITRSGGSGDAVTFPRVIGIECAGEVVDASDSDLEVGQAVVAAMGEMGRAFDGGYQQYALLRYTRARELAELAGSDGLRHLVDDAQALEAFHRLRWLVGQVVERLGGSPDRVDGHVARFQRESPQPADGGSLAAVRVAVAQHQADP